MKVNEMIIRDFQPDDGMEDEGSEIQAVVIDLFVEATSDWNAKEYLMALRSLRHRIDTYIDSAEYFVAEGE
tara:strand:+ start:576 stop:788 length:213 start_codon:yes stop_codon:yes gene_type:complete